MLTYIYLNVNECLLLSSMPQQRLKLHISLNYGNIYQNVVSWSVLMLKVALMSHGQYGSTDTLEAQIIIDISCMPGWMNTIVHQVCT